MDVSSRLRHQAGRRRGQIGQSLPLVALLLPFVGALLMTSLEIGERLLERALVEDALRQAARSAVQTFDYAGFAADVGRLAPGDAPASQGCADAAVGSARAIGCRVLRANLAGVRGLAETPDELMARVEWVILPAGGTCALPGDRPPVTATTPLVCATARPQMRGLLGWGEWSPLITAAETIETDE